MLLRVILRTHPRSTPCSDRMPERGCVESDEISRSDGTESCVLWRFWDVAEQPWLDSCTRSGSRGVVRDGVAGKKMGGEK